MTFLLPTCLATLSSVCLTPLPPALPCILAIVTALLHFQFVIGFDKREVCNARMSGEQAAIEIHTTHVYAFPVSSVNVASGEDVPDQAVDLKHKLKFLPVYQLS